MIATDGPVECHRHRWPIWRIAAPLFALLFGLYQVIIPPPPPLEPMLVFAAAAAPLPAQTHAPDTCPPGDSCPGVVIEQALPRLPVPPLLPLVAVGAIPFALHWQRRTPLARHGWWWPPDQRRALLQVFLI